MFLTCISILILYLACYVKVVIVFFYFSFSKYFDRFNVVYMIAVTRNATRKSNDTANKTEYLQNVKRKQ